MSETDIWNFRPSDETRELVNRVEEEVDAVSNRTDALNFIIGLQRDLVESGGMDILFDLMAMEEPVVVSEGEHEQVKMAVKEALREEGLTGEGRADAAD